MISERWERIKALFEAAHERLPGERAAWLAESCGDDHALRAEVARLLVADERAGGFLEMPAAVAALGDLELEAAEELLTDNQSHSLEGRHVGAYKILSFLGAGGMGEVYRARDSRLGRDVAIKVLPRVFTTDPERLARFEREARMLAALNHPHIATIHGVEEAEGIRALILELVEGPTLADRLAAGPLPIQQALSIARDIADALDAAHEKGIIHRDLKPANIKIASDGTVKVLDFGTAKMTAVIGATRDLSQLSNVPMSGTSEGMILGTTAYMSPEQARGQAVDKRTDVWAFGCVLYEMVTGRAAFAGTTTADTIAAILDREPDWRALPESTPASVRRLLQRCLDKDPKRRLRDIGDARVEIDDAPTSHATATIQAAQYRAPAARRWIAAVSLATAAAVLAFVTGRLTIGPSATSEVQVHRLTDWVGLEEAPAISPDGRSIAFVANTGASRQIWLRLIAGGTPLQLTRDSRDHLFPRWSRDSSSVLFFTPAEEGAAPGALWEVRALGGPARRIADGIGGADISHDGSKLAFFRFEAGRVELVVAARDGSALRSIAQLEAGYHYLSPRWSPGDRLIAYHRTLLSDADIFVVPVTGGTPQQVTQDAAALEGLTWSSDGSRIIFSSARRATIRYLPTANLWSIAPTGRELRQLTFGEATYGNPDVSRSDSVVASRWREQSDLWRIPVDGSPIENVARATRMTRQTSQVFTPSPSPDGTQIAYVSNAGAHANIWVNALGSGESRQITYHQEPDVQVGLPLWSPAGDRIAYFTGRHDSFNYWVVNPDGSNRRLFAPNAASAAWSADGRWLYFSERPIFRHLKKVPSSGGTAVTVRSDTAARAAPSPDGRTLYYVVELALWTGGSDYELRAASPESGPSRLLARIPDRRMPRLYSWQPVVSPDGRWLLLALVDDPTTNLWALSTTTGELRQLTDFQGRPTVIVRRAAWAPDGRSVFAAIGERDADIVLLEGLRDR